RDSSVTGVQTCALPILGFCTIQNPHLPKPSYSPIHPFTHMLPIHPAHLVTYSPIHLFTYSPIHLFTHMLTIHPAHQSHNLFSPQQSQWAWKSSLRGTGEETGEEIK